jgi:hypothetical protein
VANAQLHPGRSDLAHRAATASGLRVTGVVIGVLSLAAGASAQVPVLAAERPPGPSVTIGGQIRQQFERFVNEDWGAEPPDPDGYWLQRYMWHVDARVWRQLRLYGELKSGIETGRAGGPRPPDEDRLDLHQAFMDVSHGALTWRIGRQELAFGSQRLVSRREGPNVRQTFDAGSVIVARGRWLLHGFGGRYVRTDRGVFDDGSDTGRALWGVYAVRGRERQQPGLDVYYLGYRRTQATFDQGPGRERRHSWGARLWGNRGAFDYNVEAVVQGGSFAATTIRAWTVASDSGYLMDSPAGPSRVGVRADVTSGDRDRDDDRLGTFNPLFPKGAYFGLIASAAPANHSDLHPQVSITLPSRVVVTTSWLMFWRRQRDDGLYGIAGNVLRSGHGTRSLFVGHSPGVEAEWQLTERLSLTSDASLFTAGPFIHESGPAHTIVFIAAWATYRF